MIVYSTDRVLLYWDDCLAALQTLPDNSIDSCVTDPPYGLGFMNREWDKVLPDPAIWRELLRVLKPGAHACVMGAPRMYHRLACALEDAGFELRDCMMWLFGSGFPKSRNVALGIDKYFGYENRGRAIPTASTYQACDEEQEERLTSNPVEEYGAKTAQAQAWEGWGTALKPAYEPIALCRKPLEGTVAENVLGYGVGGLNIDACRVVSDEDTRRNARGGNNGLVGSNTYKIRERRADEKPQSSGRWPANILHDSSDEVLECFPLSPGQLGPSGGASKGYGGYVLRPRVASKGYGGYGPRPNGRDYYDTGSAAMFFYCAKASKAEREAGLFNQGEVCSDGRSKPIDNPYLRGETKRRNTHPTVKPLALIEHLVTLVTPTDGLVLDPFVGSGTTIIAALNKGFRCVAVEREEKYVNEIIIPKLEARCL